MEHLFKKLYSEVLYSDKGFKGLNSESESRIGEIVESCSGKLEAEELEVLEDSITSAVFQAQRGGYRLGIKHAFRAALWMLLK